VFTVVLVCAAAQPAWAAKELSTWKLTPNTERLLGERQLKRAASREPAEAIRALDQARAAEETPGVNTAIAEVALRAGLRGPAAEAPGLFLRAAAETYTAALEKASAGVEHELHLRALEGLVTVLQRLEPGRLDGTPLEFVGPLESWELEWQDASHIWTPATHDFIAASRYRKVKTKLSGATRPGVGLPVVAWQKEGVPDDSAPEGGYFPSYLYSYALTAVLELDEKRGEGPCRAQLRMVDPRLHDTHEVAGVAYPLALDIRAQLAALNQEVDIAFGKAGTVHAGKYLSLTGLYPLEPPRQDKIPVVMIHGLTSSIRTWAGTFEAISLDPELRRRYQFTLFTYPTGLSFPYSAALLRRALLERFEAFDTGEEDALLWRTVLIGHSMGGLLARFQVTDSGQTLWDAVFTESADEIDLLPRDKDFARELLVFEPLPFVERVVFCSTPHRGAEMASGAIGRVGISFVKLPGELKEISDRVISSNPDAVRGRGAERKKFPDGVQSLQPEYDVILALDTLSIDSRVTYHSLIGDRGKGDSPDSSDGFVDYWSSSLEGAESEKIVPSNHSTHHHQDGIAELVRILHLHLDER
jgi:hypothetical protein